MSFAQAVPSTYQIDMDLCLNKHGMVACDKCFQACQRQCVDYSQKDELLTLEVGTIIVATGVDVYDPTPLTEFGYRKFPNVITSLEFERLINAGGPSGGKSDSAVRSADPQNRGLSPMHRVPLQTIQYLLQQHLLHEYH